MEQPRRGGNEATKAKVVKALKLSPLFDKASKASREAAPSEARVDVLAGGTVIAAQGQAATDLLILARGRARVERLVAHGKAMPLGYRGSGDSLNETCLSERANEHTESVIAMEEVEVVRLPLELMRGLIARDAGLASSVLAVMLGRQREVEDRIESLLFRDVEGRVCEFLLHAGDRWGVPTPKGTLISAPITHLEIANAIGSTRETVTLTLGALRRRELIDVAGRRLILRDKDALAARKEAC